LTELVEERAPRLGALLRAEKCIEKKPVSYLLSLGEVLAEIDEAGRWLDDTLLGTINSLPTRVEQARIDYEDNYLWLTNPDAYTRKETEAWEQANAKIRQENEERRQREQQQKEHHQRRVDEERKKEERSKIKADRRFLADYRARHPVLKPEITQYVRELEEKIARYDAKHPGSD
jgi:hypothetical protein